MSEAIPSITPNPTFTTQPDTSDCVPSVTAIPEADDMFAEITIYADNKTRTYEVMPDVDEETLKDNVGWLPSSSLPYDVITSYSIHYTKLYDNANRNDGLCEIPRADI